MTLCDVARRCELCELESQSPTEEPCASCSTFAERPEWRPKRSLLADAPEPGAKHDSGKPRYDLLPAAAEAEIVEVLTHGADKYAPDNWRKVTDPVERYYAALRRHLAAWRLGEELDSESGLRNLAHVATNAVFLMELTRKEQAK